MGSRDPWKTGHGLRGLFPRTGRRRCIPQGKLKIWCGGTFEIAECVPRFETQKITVDEKGNKIDPKIGDDGKPEYPTKEVFKECVAKSVGKKHTVRCQ